MKTTGLFLKVRGLLGKNKGTRKRTYVLFLSFFSYTGGERR
ncbi:hypothetical protein HMPREF9130_1342 [Peptoniphilus sp. oral taxon 375 str. F0436]|nr:hypothetical protein HMPREF9130_1342 [Peptoniphilus sp. oral taxon 375 str. F0436]